MSCISLTLGLATLSFVHPTDTWDGLPFLLVAAGVGLDLLC
jgi:hypothetical protein